ncbi:hypothetical protein F4802DRAFT_68739 [Xylaria palmicola]|nr:hypothetical protein F4802DRAFT_68739 [Xylaria palmicola]
MAPPTKGANPAPDYAVAMNRVQTQLEAQLRVVRSFMPPRPPATHAAAAPAKPTTSSSSSFSALASSSTRTPASSSSSSAQAQARHRDEDSLFAETRAQDPNAGLSFSTPGRPRGDEAKERENQLLRARLLGRGRKRGAADASGRRAGREAGSSSSDDEPGRSGLGRAKKRARRDESAGRGGALPPVAPECAPERAGITPSKDKELGNDKAVEGENGGVDIGDNQDTALPRDELARNGLAGAPEQQENKKRKKKKKKKKGNLKETEGE